jgi:hypothetical protein
MQAASGSSVSTAAVRIGREAVGAMAVPANWTAALVRGHVVVVRDRRPRTGPAMIGQARAARAGSARQA